MTRGRFAPSPTGELHLGNARTALLAWLWARHAGGSFAMRIEDLDRPRCKPGLAEQQLRELRWLGLDWDGELVHQSQRSALYDAAIERLRVDGRVYECFCSRAEIRAAAQLAGPATQSSEASAPHGPQDDGPRYPGTCASLNQAQIAERKQTREPALRLRVPPGAVSFDDAIAGPQSFDPASEIGDFVLRRADGNHSYQLAVVVDDAAMGITQVLRGADLLPSTARQILLYRFLGFAPPAWAHAPLLFGPPGLDGQPQKLSKRSGEGGLRQLMMANKDPNQIVAELARSSGLVDANITAVTPRELIAGFSLEPLRLAAAPKPAGAHL